MQSECIQQWHKIVAARQVDKLAGLLSDEVVFYSPVVHTPQVGKAITLKYLSAAFDVLLTDSFQYVSEMGNLHQAALEFQLDLDGTAVNGVDLITWNDEQKITEFKVMVRPLKAIGLVQKLMAERLTA